MSHTFTIKLANLKIKISCIHDRTFNICKDYLTANEENDFEINMSQEDIDSEKQYFEGNNKFSDEYLEASALYRKIAEKLIEYNGLVLHGAAIEYKGRCYIFVAPSGTGKTTHINMWIKHLDNIKVINGDKPIIRMIDGIPIAFGTPWMGKEGMGTNSSCKLNSIIVLKRGNEDYINKVNIQDYLQDLLSKIYVPKNDILKTFDIIESVYKNINFYELYCTMKDSAFITSFEMLTGEKYES